MKAAEATDKREGDVFDHPVRVRCPYCRTPGTTRYEVNLCGSCGEWFEVRK